MRGSLSQETLRAVLALVRTHGGEGGPAVIVDSNEQVFAGSAAGSQRIFLGHGTAGTTTMSTMGARATR